MRRFAVFVDAGYFWVQMISAVIGTPHGARADIVVNFPKLREDLLSCASSVCQSRDLLRIYWYDGPGTHGKGSDHLSIEDLDDFKLRLGMRNSQGQQKAVDGLIIADILSLTQSKAIESAFLISGDADLAPGVIAAQALGLRLHLGILAPKSSTSLYLAAEADTKFYFPTNWALGFAQPCSRPGQTAPATSEADSTEVASSVQQPSATWANSAAGKVFNALQSATDASLLAGISKGKVPLPREIDGQLLAAGKKEIGRVLSEDEKRALRVTFKNFLP